MAWNKKVKFKTIFFTCLALVTQSVALDFDKPISLKECKRTPDCRKGLLLEGSWKSNDFKNSCKNTSHSYRCDWYDKYLYFCLDIKAKVLDAKEDFESHIGYEKLWGKKSSYFDLNEDVWKLIRDAAQFEIDCFEILPEQVVPILGERRVNIGGMSKGPTGISMEGFTEKYSAALLKEAESMQKMIWRDVKPAQNHMDENSPRNLSLLGGEFSPYGNSSFDEYYKLVKQMSTSVFLSKDLKEVVLKEMKILTESERVLGKKCLLIDDSMPFNEIAESKNYCTLFSLSESRYKEYQKKITDIEKKIWDLIVKLSEENPEKIVADNSVAELYLKSFSKGMYEEQVNNLYEKTLAKEGLNQAKSDTIAGLSDSSFLRKYLQKYPNGKYANKISVYLEKLLFNYALSQINNNIDAAIISDSYVSQYQKKYPNGKYGDSLNVSLEMAWWKNFSLKCMRKQDVESCSPLFEFSIYFPKSDLLDTVKLLIDNPLWSTIKKKECVYLDDDVCLEIEDYVENFPRGKHIAEAQKLLTNAKQNSEKKDVEEQKKNEQEKLALVWMSEYKSVQKGCVFITKEDRYEWNAESGFPEKNGRIECVDRNDLSLDSLDTLLYKCIEKDDIIVKNGKISGGKGFCINAVQDTLIQKYFLSNGKSRFTIHFPNNISLVVKENGTYSISSKSIKLNELDVSVVSQIMSFINEDCDWTYLMDIEEVKFEWSSSGYVKNIRIKEKDENGNVLGKLNIPLNSKAEKQGVSEINAVATGNFKIEWNNGAFKRIMPLSEKLIRALCPPDACRNLSYRLMDVDTIESSRESAYDNGIEGRRMIYYIAYLLGISINEALGIWIDCYNIIMWGK